jgi:hypothetical protein
MKMHRRCVREIVKEANYGTWKLSKSQMNCTSLRYDTSLNDAKSAESRGWTGSSTEMNIVSRNRAESLEST